MRVLTWTGQQASDASRGISACGSCEEEKTRRGDAATEAEPNERKEREREREKKKDGSAQGSEGRELPRRGRFDPLREIELLRLVLGLATSGIRRLSSCS